MNSVNYEHFFKKLEDEGSLVKDTAMLGWGFLPNEKTARGGYFDESALRALADEIERRNKPFWDEYDKYCASLPVLDEKDTIFEPVT